MARDIDNTVESVTPPAAAPGVVVATDALDPGVLITGNGRLTESALRGTTQAVLLTGARASLSHSTVSAIAPGGVGVRAAGAKQRVIDVEIEAETACVQLAGPVENTFSRVSALLCSGRNPKKTMGVELVSGGQYSIGGDFVRVFNPIYQGHLAGNFALDFTTRMAFGCGPKVVLQSFGGRISGYSAWGSGGCGYCAGGSLAKTICDVADDCGDEGRCVDGRCVAGERDGRPCDCPSSTCTPFPDILIGTWKPKMAAVSHAEIRGAILHTSSPGVALVAAVPAEKRCTGGARAFETCSTSDTTDCPHGCGASARNAGRACRMPPECTCGSDADCPGGTCVRGACAGGAICGGGGKCGAPVHSDVVFSDVKILSGLPDAIGYDFGNFAADTSCRNCVVSGGEIGLWGTGSIGLRFPTDVAGLSNFQMRGVAFDRRVTDKLRDWSWSMGSIVASGPLDPDDDQVMPLLYDNDAGSGLVAGDVVELSPHRPNAVRRTMPRSTVPIGCILDSPDEGAVGQVASSGTVTCRATDVPIAIGTRLRVSSTPGALEAASPVDDAWALAQAPSVDMGDHQAVRVTIMPSLGSSRSRR